MNLNRVQSVVARIRENGNVHQHLDLIAGLPLEGLGEFAKSFDDVMDVGAGKVQLGFFEGAPWLGNGGGSGPVWH